MSKTLKMHRRVAVRSGAVAAAVTLGGSLLAAVPASAHPGTPLRPTLPYGTVITTSGVNERMYPSTDSSVLGFLAYRSRVALRCKVRTQTILGNEIWYLLRDRQAWVTAKYVANTGSVRFCKDVQPSPLNNTPQAKTARG